MTGQHSGRDAGDGAVLAVRCPLAPASDADLVECSPRCLRPAASLDAPEVLEQPEREPAAARSPRARRPPKVYEDVRARRPAPAHPTPSAFRKPADKVEVAGGSAAEGAAPDARIPGSGADEGQEQALQQAEPSREGLPDSAEDSEVLRVPTAVARTADGRCAGTAASAAMAASASAAAVAPGQPAVEQAATAQTAAEVATAEQSLAEGETARQAADAFSVGQKRKRDTYDSAPGIGAHLPVRLRACASQPPRGSSIQQNWQRKTCIDVCIAQLDFCVTVALSAPNAKPCFDQIGLMPGTRQFSWPHLANVVPTDYPGVLSFGLFCVTGTIYPMRSLPGGD